MRCVVLNDVPIFHPSWAWQICRPVLKLLQLTINFQHHTSMPIIANSKTNIMVDVPLQELKKHRLVDLFRLCHNPYSQIIHAYCPPQVLYPNRTSYNKKSPRSSPGDFAFYSQCAMPYFATSSNALSS